MSSPFTKKTEEEATLAQELSTCMFQHYKFFAAGVLLGLPLSVKNKSYWPFTFAAVAGSAADMIEAQKTCKPQQDALNACIARQKAFHQQEGGNQPVGADPPELLPQQQDGEGDWPQHEWEGGFGKGEAAREEWVGGKEGRGRDKW